MTEKKNKTKTSKYTPVTFFPLNLYRQFSKYSNVFFFITLMLLITPSISPFPPYAYLTAFMIVMGISILKDGIEDFIRHRSDKKANERIIHKIMLNTQGKEPAQDFETFTYKTNTAVTSENETETLKNRNSETKGEKQQDQDLEHTKSIKNDQKSPCSELFSIQPKFVEDLKMFDVILLKENEEVPADMILLNSKIFNGTITKCRPFSYIQTSSLDGETNLKKRQSNFLHDSTGCTNNTDNSNLFLCNCDIKVINGLEGIDILPGGTEFNDISALVKFDSKRLLQTEKNIILRGTQIKSTTMTLGMVIAVGENTKIARNQHKTGLKRSKFEKKVERKMFYMFILYFIILFVSAIILTLNLRNDQTDLFDIDQLSKMGLRLIGTNYVLYSYLIPLSLFVMIEIARIFQKTFIKFDQDINGAFCKNSNVTEDIGMIDIVLSDKTGTLTENKMNFNFYDIGHGIEPISTLNIDQGFFFVMNILTNNGLQIVNQKFEGISQDEIAMVEKIQNYGCFLKTKEDSHMELKLGNHNLVIEILATLEFSSQRQRMSTMIKITKTDIDRVKAGDIFLFTKGSDQRLASCLENEITTETNPVYRSLLCIYRKLESKTEIENFLSEYQESALKTEKMDKLFEQVESGMKFSGIAYVEDKIAFKAQETVKQLKEAGIKMWMVTGDKKETALSCGRSVGLTNTEAIRPDQIIEEMASIECSQISRQYWMEKLPDTLIIYRTIPDKKAAIAKALVEKGLSVLAIGDGGNDVSMIYMATVGVGIKGKEGGQAALAGDFSLVSFHHLSKLLFFHGRNNLIRFSKLTINSFFKNIFLITFQFNFNFLTGFSGLSVFNYYFVNYFNILYSAFIPFSIAVFDKGKDAHYFMDLTTQGQIIKNYQKTRSYFSGKTIAFSIIYAITKGTILYWISYFIIDWSYTFSIIYFSWVVFLSTFLFQTYLIEFFNFFTFLSIFLTFGSFLFSMFVLNESGYAIYGTGTFYIALFTVLMANLALDLLFFKYSKKYDVHIF
ncbi:HAD ATPase, P-type, family IC [Pseudoloma neurophilia]|uniref:HAD ATPase, P-type, family IC n=1 Tax=Pseudoloma neurophilia TaxID=146866 RepID=A0A0R0LYT1_9MICR|nr:HAD ATPase, P-type, family IC [Pseudoloma neurophilia]